MRVSCEGPVWGRQGQEAAEKPPLPPLGLRGCTPSPVPSLPNPCPPRHPQAPPGTGSSPSEQASTSGPSVCQSPFSEESTREVEKEEQQQRQEARGPEFTQKMKGGLHTRPGERKPSVSAKTWSNLESVTTGHEILTISRKCLEV